MATKIEAFVCARDASVLHSLFTRSFLSISWKYMWPISRCWISGMSKDLSVCALNVSSRILSPKCSIFDLRFQWRKYGKSNEKNEKTLVDRKRARSCSSQKVLVASSALYRPFCPWAAISHLTFCGWWDHFVTSSSRYTYFCCDYFLKRHQSNNSRWAI